MDDGLCTLLAMLHDCGMPREQLADESVCDWWAAVHQPLADRVAELEAEVADDACVDAIDECFKLADGKPEWDYPGQLVHLVQVLLKDRDRVAELESAAKPRPMSESRAIALGVHIRIRSLSKGWVVCHCCDHVGWVVSIGDHDDVIRDGVEWLPLFPNEDSA